MSGPVNIVVNGHRQTVQTGPPAASVQARRSIFERKLQPASATKTNSPSGGTTRQIVPRASNFAVSSTVSSKSSAISSTSSAVSSKTSAISPTNSAVSPTNSAVSPKTSAVSSRVSIAIPQAASTTRQKSAPSLQWAPSSTSTAASHRPAGVSGVGGGVGSGASSRSWFFGTDISSAPEGAIAVRLTPSASGVASASSQSAQPTQSSQMMTPERRAQATVWDHLRSERSGVVADPALEAEARRLIAAAGSADPSPEGRRKKRLCFARDSNLAETFEYQSERSLMDELKITPDYPAESFDVAPPMIRRALAQQQQRLQQQPGSKERPLSSPPLHHPLHHHQQQQQPAELEEMSGKSHDAATADIGSYRAKLANEAGFEWGSGGSSRSARLTEAEDAALDHHQQQQQQTQQTQWSISTTPDMLF